MARDPDNPYGIRFWGSERPMSFLNPYRWRGELNEVERWKQDRHPLEAARDVVTKYAVEGPAAIYSTPGEIERLKWVGVYPQRQGGDAFMLRIKVPGGRLQADQLREIGVVADAFAEGPDDSELFGNRYADLTTRQDIQLHWIRIEDVPRIWQRLFDVGVTTLQACGDSNRNVTCCPVSGVDAEEAFDAYPTARRISDFFTGNREYSNLPRKFKIGLTGCRENCARVEINDIGLWPARAGDGTLGFNVLAGGGLSDGERMASDIDVFVGEEDALEVCRAIAQLFGELGNRENRGLSRMRYLVQELGPEGFRAALQARTRLQLAPAGAELTTSFRGDHVGVFPQRQEGLFYVGGCVPVGRMRGIELVELARLARTYGDGTIRIGTDQNFVLTGVPEARVDDLLAEELLATYSPFPGPFERGVVACTGSEFCRFAVTETKERAVRMARALDRQVAEGGAPSPVPVALGRRPEGSRSVRGEDRGVVRLHFSGCSAGCAQPQIADIGLRGELAHVGEHIEEAVDIGLGGSLGPDAAFIDWVAGAVPVTSATAALSGLLARFVDERRVDEPFYAWARRTENDELRRTIASAAAGAAT
jgi:ferredoxin-nitrite reductase